MVNLSVSVANNFQVDDFDGELDAVSTGFAQSYTREMKDIFQAYEDANNLEDDIYYIFLLPKFADTDQLGYMPRKRDFGFVNHEQLLSDEGGYVKTIAHELAHGAFVLHHTFEQHPQLKDNPTQNLLDYSKKGTITHQYQWAGMHNPSRAWTMFDEDEDRANYASGFEYFTSYGFGLNQDSSFNFITPAWQYINLPKNAKNIVVYFGISALSSETSKLERDLIRIPGTLKSFEVDGIKYNGRFSISNNKHFFDGYFSDANTAFDVLEEVPYSEEQILWGTNKTSYQFILHKENLSSYQINQQLKEVTEIEGLVSEEIQNFSYSNDDPKFSFSQLTLNESTVNKIFNNYLGDDNSFLVRNKLAEIRVGYENIFDISTDFFGEWDCSEMEGGLYSYPANQIFFVDGIDYDLEYFEKYCECETNQGGRSCSYKTGVNIPKIDLALEEHYLFLKKHLLSGYQPDLPKLIDYEVEENLLNDISSFDDFNKLVAVVNISSINDFKTISELTAFKIISKLLVRNIVAETNLLKLDTEGAIIKIFESIPKYQYYDFLKYLDCLLYTSPSPRDATLSRMPSSA